ncbi:probable caffeine synthase MTL3 [Rutidosis leptorrhynchoides]|uniref:probable caffeine synthase MTL3 n=1 Tax=Rutidosis leptorrhynchoides TaxID=125765 RepID=UPI003A9A4E00
MAVATLSELLHMNSENEESSYANNSSLQESVIKKAQMILKETIKGITDSDGFPRCFCIADLGCSSGPNTLLVISNIIDEVHGVCKEKNLEAPQFHICLNDLFLNDFNSIFKSLPMFYAKYNVDKEGSSGRCFISAVPGSFYGRLFSDKSMHFFHSSTSLQWLSQAVYPEKYQSYIGTKLKVYGFNPTIWEIPKGLENNNLNIYMSNTSPPIVCEIYKKQFEKDFTKNIWLQRWENFVLFFGDDTSSLKTFGDDICGAFCGAPAPLKVKRKKVEFN